MDSSTQNNREQHPQVNPGTHAHSSKSAQPKKSNLIDIPTIQLPKGGGAIKGIDEKFSVNSANGTASFSLPLPFSHTRSNFAPHISLAYNSGSGNSPFGLGWNIDLPSIHRRTEKLLPVYMDGEESDVFQFSGVEDLVPAYFEGAQKHWQIDAFASGTLVVKRYKPRTEGGFNLIERVTRPDNTSYWKITSRDNVVTFYGYTKNSRLADPKDETRIFRWLPEVCFDDKGNCYAYTYKAENTDNVANVINENSRLSDPQSFANTYLKSVRYGNTALFVPGDIYTPGDVQAMNFMFGMVIDYGDHNEAAPSLLPDQLWPMRLDPFSDCKAGFEARTYRLCKRFLVFHHFPDLDANPVVVRSIEPQYKYFDFNALPDPAHPALIEAELVMSVKEVSWLGNGTAGYQTKAYPAATFTYNLPEWNHDVQTISPDSLYQLPVGLGTGYQFTDLWNEGLPGILTEQGEALYYKSNLGDGQFTPAVPVTPKPSLGGLSNGSLQLTALEADGRKFIVHTEAPVRGYYEIDDDGEIYPFQVFQDYPVIDFKDPNTKFIDLNGDGRPDIIVSEENVFRYYPSLGTIGYDSAETAPKPFDEELGPAIVFADPVQCIFLADMNGDGLTDIARIRNGEVCYWPNMGYGRFGAKVNMMNAPVFDTADRFNPAYLHLADINGTGVSDILYLGQNTFKAWLNLCGNGWSEPTEWDAFPGTALQNQVMVADILGQGTACIVWSSPLPQNASNPMRYIDLMGGNKPYLMTQFENGMGKTTAMTYKQSTWFYLQDKINGTPWITKLPFPVHVVTKTTVTDSISGTSYGSSYSYHHGYYDHAEKEFRGFGRVEQTDLEVYDVETAQPFDQVPVLTKTWYHNGIYFDADRILGLYTQEYFQNSQFSEYILPQPVLPAGLGSTELREAARACKGMVLRQEVYALDKDTNPELCGNPYTVTEHNCQILLMQPLLDNRYTVFMNVESEQIAYHYERNPADPRIAHTLNTGIDPVYGFLLHSFHVMYGRQPGPAPSIPAGQQLPPIVLTEQQKPHITFEVNGYTDSIITSSTYRLPLSCDTITYEATGISPQQPYYSITELAALVNSSNQAKAPLQLRKIKQERTLFLDDDLVTPLQLGKIDRLAFHYQTFQLVFDGDILNNYDGLVTDQVLYDGKYIKSDDYKTQGLFPGADANGEWWSPSGTVGYLQNNTHLPFYLPWQYTDNFGHTTTVAYDAYWLMVSKTTDPAGSVMTVQNFDYRTVGPQKVSDINNNITELSFDIHGMVAGLAMKGKGDDTEGDNLAGFDPDADPTGFFNDPYANAAALLGNATFRYVYDYSVLPFRTASLVRENHVHHFTDARLSIDPHAVQMSFEYSDGFGRSAMKKIQAENYPAASKNGDCEGDGVKRRWVGAGKTVYNNKGNAVKQYEPFFSDTHAYEQAPANGVTPVMFFDPTGRVIRTDFPDGTFSTVVFDPWMEVSYDRNDLVKDSDWYAKRMDPADSLSGDVWQVDTADKAAVHYGTPGIQHLDSLGRGFYSVILNKAKVNDPITPIATYSTLDIEGNPLQVTDARQNTVMAHAYDMANRPLKQVSIDAGTKYTLNDSMNKNYYKWDYNNGQQLTLTTDYDALHRPVNNCVAIGNAPPVIFERMVYGEGMVINGQPDVANNMRGQIYKHYDSAGLLTNHQFDFKGSVLQGGRRFARAYKPAQSGSMLQPVIWTGNAAVDDALLEADEYVSVTQCDATNRVLMSIRSFKVPAPAGIIQPPYTAVNGADIIVHSYSLSGHLKTVDVYKGGGNVATNYVSRICHNEKGQRLCIQYGNNTVTRYAYDPLTFHMTRLLTTRNKGAEILQDINYYFDPVGNITHQVDNAQQTIFFRNQIVSPDVDYTFDAIYQLITAKGREHVGQGLPPSCNDNDRMQNAQPGDGNQMRNYTQYYIYDTVGNMQEMGNLNSWKRTFNYDNATNRLKSINPGSTNGAGVPYKYDAHGNMLNMEQLNHVDWNFKDELQHVNMLGGGDAYYNYDSSGSRIRKVWEKNANLVCERRYMGDYELYREYDGVGNILLERETLMVADDKTRIALVENLTQGDDQKVPFLVRYQYGNHLGSASLELDDTASIITYEEYYPFGSTSYKATDSTREVPEKRYRYTGKERDEETGFNYHNARYYAPWLCRWTATDPIGIQDGVNVYAYTRNNPVVHHDKTGTATLPKPAIYGIEGGIVKAAESSPMGTYVKGAMKWYAEMTSTGYNGESGGQTIFTTRTYFDKGVGKEGIADIVSQFNADTKMFTGTGATNQYINTGKALKEYGLGAAVRADDFKTFTMRFGELKGFKLNIMHDKTVDALLQGGKFEETAIGQHMVKAAKAVGLRLATVNAKAAGGAGGYRAALATGTFENAPGMIAKFRRGSIAATGFAAKVASKVPGLAKATAPLAKAIAPVARVAAPVLRVVGKVAGPLAVAAGVYQVVTAKTNTERIQAGADTLAGAAAFAGPVGTAFSLGYTGGQMLDKGAEYATKKIFGKDYSPSSLISMGMTKVDEKVSGYFADPNKPAYTQTLGWKLANWLD